MQELVDKLLLAIGCEVKARRTVLKISQEELASRSGLHRTYISDVERGARNLSLSTIYGLALALDMSVSSLLSRAEDRILAAAP